MNFLKSIWSAVITKVLAMATGGGVPRNAIPSHTGNLGAE